MTKTDEKPYTFSSKRTQCPECGSSDGRADIIHDARTDTSYNLDSGYFKCHSCDTIKTPNIHEKDWRTNDAPKISKVSNKPKKVELPLNERKRILSDNYNESMQSTASGFHVYLQALKSQIRDITVLETFEIGTDKANATNFWYRDINGDLSFAKTMAYSNECKRLKEDNNPLKNADGTSKTALNGYTKGKSSKGLIYEYHISDLGYNTNGIFNYNRLQQGDYDKIIILESEKNCVFATILFPQYCFVTGGGSNALSDGKFEIVSKFAKMYNKSISVLYDLDKAGYENSDKLADKHNVTNLTHLFKDYIDGIKSIDAPSGFDVADYCGLIFTNKLKSHKKKDLIFELEKIENPELGKAEKVPLSILSYKKMKAYLAEAYQFRYNTVKTRYEYKVNGYDWTASVDRSYNSIFDDILEQCIEVDFQKLTRFIESKHTPEYDPLKEWLNELPNYDIHKEPDYIQQLAEKIEVDDCDTEVRNDYFKRWFVSLYAQATLQNCSQFLLVFIGSHGIGKDQFAKSLLPKRLQEYVSGFNFMNLNTDAKFAMCNNLILSCAELEYMNRADQAKVKEIIGVNDFFMRASYGRVNQTYYRRAALIGSANMESILADETGSRRYLVMRANNIKWQEIDDKLLERAYKQAQYIYDVLGYNFHFTQKEIAEVNEYNEQFRTTTLPEELIRMHFRIASDYEDGFTAGELMLKLMNYSNQMKEYHNNRLGAILKKLGYSQKLVKSNGQVSRRYNITEKVNINQYSANYSNN